MTQDLLIDNYYEARIRNGDFDVGESDQQHIQLLLETSQGEWRESPLTGVNLREWLAEDAGQASLFQAITTQLALDGATVRQLSINNQQLNINAEYL